MRFAPVMPFWVEELCPPDRLFGFDFGLLQLLARWPKLLQLKHFSLGLGHASRMCSGEPQRVHRVAGCRFDWLRYPDPLLPY